MPFEKEKTCCIIGNRVITPDVQVQIHAATKNLIGQGYTHFIMGTGKPFDNFAAFHVLSLKKEYPDITLEIIVPYHNHKARQDILQQIISAYITQLADAATYVLTAHDKRATAELNKYIIDNCSVAILEYDDTQLSCGVKNAVGYAQRRGIKIYSIANI